MAAYERCTNPRDRRYPGYGGRGIQFKFPSVLAACLWVKDTLGMCKDKQIDRIDNNGHYEAGNLQWSTAQQNHAHTRKRPISPAWHYFRLHYPEIQYADVTLSRLLGQGYTFEAIIDRYYQPSNKPKGVYGTYSTPDPVIASLYQEF